MRNRRSRNNQQGFTLLEVMVVIVIIGLMATLVIPNIMGSKERANKQKTKADINVLENALEMYHIDHNNYPSNDKGLNALTTEGGQGGDNSISGGYIHSLPKDPWGNNYQYANPGVHKDVDIYSSGPDGKPGTQDDIGNWSK